MLDSALWGLVQGLTEFLPISSSGHLVLVPAFLNKDAPDLATTAVLHLGTLAAVLWYFRRDIAWLVRTDRDPQAWHIVKLLALGTVPAVVAGLLLESTLEDLFHSPTRVGLALIFTGIVLLAGGSFHRLTRTLEEAGVPDAIIVGSAQAVALVPGVSRSGMTITASLGRGFTKEQSARFSFLLAVPVILGGGAKQMLDLAGEGGLEWDLLVGVLVAAVSGYVAIAVLIKALIRYGLEPFALYCFAVGLVAVIWY
ncbi:MAG: undecaprenyl-diphosphate phosphatase [Acidimicrobiia bacterium]|nr:undecaprenyl-diphosphate phosphatase [Acidimicrobiia bacterium]